MRRSSILDILKGICICIVIFTHFSWTSEERMEYFFPIWIDMAIPMCMVISGYVYTQSFLHKGIMSADDAYSFAGGGLHKRILRYTIPFIIAWMIELYLLKVFSIREILLPKELLREFLTGGIGPGSYYYPILIQLTILFPVIYFSICRYRNKGLAVCCISNILFELLQWAYGMNTSTYRLLVFRYIQLFAFGCYFAVGGKLVNKQCIVLFLAGIVGSYLNCAKEITPFFITSWQTTSFLTSLHVIPVFYWLHNTSYKCIILETIGKASYNIFLVQMVYYTTLASKVYNIVGSRANCLIANMFICICTGVVFYYIETPISKVCISYIDRIYSRRIVSSKNM